MAASSARCSATPPAPAASRSSAPTTRPSVTSSSPTTRSPCDASTTRPTSSHISPSPRRRRSDPARLSHQAGEPSRDGIVPTDESLDPTERLLTVDAAGVDDRLDIGPVSRPVEQRLEDDDRGAVDHGNLASDERYPTHVGLDVAVELVNGEEQIEGRVRPPHPNLPVAFGGLDLDPSHRDAFGQTREHIRRSGGPDEQVHVDVTRAARLFGAVGERDG